MTGGYTMKEKNIQELAKRMGLVTVEDMCQYTIAQLVVKIANKVNELVNEVWRFETDVQEIVKTQNENIQYLLGEGLHLEVENIFDGWVNDGTFDTLINQSALKKVNDRIDETNAQLSHKINKGESGVITNAMLSQEVKESMTGGSVAVVGKDTILTENIVNNQITGDKMHNSAFGVKYYVNQTGAYPSLDFNVKNAKSAKNITVKFKCNLSDFNGASLLVKHNYSGSYNQYEVRPSLNVDDSYEITWDIQTSRVIEKFSFICNRNSSVAVMTGFFYDIQLFLDGVEYSSFSVDATDGVENQTEEHPIIASRKFVNEKAIECKKYTDDKLENFELFQKYDSMSKSNLKRITCWGDSITEGGSAGLPWTTVLQNLIGNHVVVNNKGVSGQCSGNIAFRQGAKQIRVGETFTIPSSTTSVNFELVDEECRNFRMGSRMDCIINGVRGSFEMIKDNETSSYSASFTRYESGNSIVVEKDALITTADDNYRNDVTIIWVGRNDIAFAWPYQIDGVIENVKSMVSHLEPTIKRFLVVSVTTATSEMESVGDYTQQYSWVMQINSKLAKLYPENFVNVQEYLSTKCIYDAGISPTENDLYAMENGTMPPSLASDGLHPDEVAKRCIAENIMYKELDKRGWLI